ncbi:MAG: hypothetical protein J4G05_11410 [Chlorobi bacterium]|nr:hypothetical protein [Chlorobiota bacterium]
MACVSSRGAIRFLNQAGTDGALTDGAIYYPMLPYGYQRNVATRLSRTFVPVAPRFTPGSQRESREYSAPKRT